MSDEQQRWPEPVYLTKDHAINMSLRDYFAAKAMQGMIAHEERANRWQVVISVISMFELLFALTVTPMP